MALHTQLPISKVTYDLSFLAAELVRNMPRDFKGLYGQRLMAECLELAMCIYRANVAKGAAKVPHLNELIERLPLKGSLAFGSQTVALAGIATP